MIKELQVLLVSDGDYWTAIGLEHSVVAWGGSIQIALSRFHETLSLELTLCSQRGEQGLQSIPPAPTFYWKKSEEAVRIDDSSALSPPVPTSYDTQRVPQDMFPKLHAAVA